MLQPISEGVFRWTAVRRSTSRPGIVHELAGFALVLPADGGIVLVDPPTLTQDECGYLESLGTPRHILLTCEWHTRASADHRARWGCRVLMHPLGVPRAEIPVDGTPEDGALLWDCVRILHVPVTYEEEVAVLFAPPDGAPTLLLGDALSGARGEQGIPNGEVALHAPRYVADFSKARRALRRLLEHPFEALGLGHGAPILTGGRAAVERCLTAEVAWLASGGREGTLDRVAAWPDKIIHDRYVATAAERARGIPPLNPY
jgi:hypothetical protein